MPRPGQGFGVQGTGFGVHSAGFGVQGAGHRVDTAGSVQALGAEEVARQSCARRNFGNFKKSRATLAAGAVAPVTDIPIISGLRTTVPLA